MRGDKEKNIKNPVGAVQKLWQQDLARFIFVGKNKTRRYHPLTRIVLFEKYYLTDFLIRR